MLPREDHPRDQPLLNASWEIVAWLKRWRSAWRRKARGDHGARRRLSTHQRSRTHVAGSLASHDPDRIKEWIRRTHQEPSSLGVRGPPAGAATGSLHRTNTHAPRDKDHLVSACMSQTRSLSLRRPEQDLANAAGAGPCAHHVFRGKHAARRGVRNERTITSLPPQK